MKEEKIFKKIYHYTDKLRKHIAKNKTMPKEEEINHIYVIKKQFDLLYMALENKGEKND